MVNGDDKVDVGEEDDDDDKDSDIDAGEDERESTAAVYKSFKGHDKKAAAGMKMRMYAMVKLIS